jgi:hypothetical protein
MLVQTVTSDPPVCLVVEVLGGGATDLEALGQLGELGAEARGAVGSDEPLEALGDAIRAFQPDHLLIALRASPTSGWQEHGLVERVVERFGLPVTVFQVSA